MRSVGLLALALSITACLGPVETRSGVAEIPLDRLATEMDRLGGARVRTCGKLERRLQDSVLLDRSRTVGTHGHPGVRVQTCRARSAGRACITGRIEDARSAADKAQNVMTVTSGPLNENWLLKESC